MKSSATKRSILPLLILLFTNPFLQAEDKIPKFQFFTPRPDTFDVQQNEKLTKITQDIPAINQAEEKDDNPSLIIPTLNDILSVLPSTKGDGSPRDVSKLKVALENSPEKVIEGINQQFLNLGLVPADKLASCPHIDALSQDVCAVAGRKPICWSPGTNDVDCPTNDAQEPFGLCCFDGCQNTCFTRTNITTPVPRTTESPTTPLTTTTTTPATTTTITTTSAPTTITTTPATTTTTTTTTTTVTTTVTTTPATTTTTPTI